MKTTLLFLLLVFSSFNEGKRLKCKVVNCPPCEYGLNETYEEFGLKYVNGSAPEDGMCYGETTKWMFYAKHYSSDFGFHDGCCCLTPPSNNTPIQCNPNGVGIPYCPIFKATGDFKGVGPNENIGEYAIRVGQTMSNAPVNGCCLPGYMKWIFKAELTHQKQDICGCVPPSDEFVDKTYMCVDNVSPYGL